MARLLVDGKPVGEFRSGPAQPAGQWVDQVLEVPATLTKGKSSVRITVEYVSSALDINEFRYDVHSRVGDSWTRTDVLDLGAAHDGEEQAHEYKIRNQSWEGQRVYRYPSDPAQVTASDAVLAGTRLRTTFDGKTTVDAPVGEFFGSGIGEYDTRTMFTGIDTAADGWYSSWWAMPYAKDAKVELVNGSGVPVTGATVEVTTARDRDIARGLSSGQLGHFNATHHSGQTTPNESWVFLEAAGSGVFYGVTHSMRGLIPAGNRRNYLEGDERVYVDGAVSPTMYGTGSTGRWTTSLATTARPRTGTAGRTCPLWRPTRWTRRTTRAVRSTRTRRPARPEARWSPQWRDERTRSRCPGRHVGHGEVSFTMAVARDNRGVRLLRLGDQSEGYQRATVLVNGKAVGEWLQPLGNTHSRWLEDSFDLPASATKGKTELTITIRP